MHQFLFRMWSKKENPNFENSKFGFSPVDKDVEK